MDKGSLKKLCSSTTDRTISRQCKKCVGVAFFECKSLEEMFGEDEVSACDEFKEENHFKDACSGLGGRMYMLAKLRLKGG